LGLGGGGGIKGVVVGWFWGAWGGVGGGGGGGGRGGGGLSQSFRVNIKLYRLFIKLV